MAWLFSNFFLLDPEGLQVLGKLESRRARFLGRGDPADDFTESNYSIVLC